jgi:hypothetical protein
MRLSMATLDQFLVVGWERMGLPSEPMFRFIRARRIAGQWSEWRERRHQAEEIIRSSPRAKLIDHDKGYYLFGRDFLPEVAPAVTEAAALFENRRPKLATDEAKKPFFANIMTADDVDNCPAIMALAQHPAMFEACAGYLGTYPKLRTVGVYVSMANTSLRQSQMFHYDTNDLNQIKCFINVSDVGEANGPFTFLPADKSRALNFSWRGGRQKDENVLEKVKSDDLISLEGPPGTGGFIDTSRCLHYGSRCREGYRLVIMIQYTPEPDLSMDPGKYAKKGTPVLVPQGH